MRLNPKNILSLTILSLVLLGINACHKKDDTTPTPTCIGGSGGDKTLVVDLKHHTLQIPNDSIYPDTVWVKYNAINAGSGYDIQKVGVSGDTTITFTGLKCGNYFLTASGYDRTIDMVVSGGIKITIADTDGVVKFTVPVTE